jgi:hypothetical protein
MIKKKVGEKDQIFGRCAPLRRWGTRGLGLALGLPSARVCSSIKAAPAATGAVV